MRARSLLPREHGAYFQLAIPLAAALARHATVAGGMLAAAAIGAFLANEPLLVTLGHRGQKLQVLLGARARMRLAILVATTCVVGIDGLALAPRAITAAAVVAVPVAILVVLACKRAEHTLAGELVAAVALTGASVPVAVAGGSDLGGALAAWAGWAAGFATAVVAVHRILATHRATRRGASSGHGSAIGIAVATVGIAALSVASHAAAIAMPLATLATLVAFVPPPASRLRAVGVAIAIAASLSGAIAAS
jgi:hypothetical protein